MDQKTGSGQLSTIRCCNLQSDIMIYNKIRCYDLSFDAIIYNNNYNNNNNNNNNCNRYNNGSRVVK